MTLELVLIFFLKQDSQNFKFKLKSFSFIDINIFLNKCKGLSSIYNQYLNLLMLIKITILCNKLFYFSVKFSNLGEHIESYPPSG